MATCNRCNEEITWKLSKKGKWYAVNEDNSFHSNTCKKPYTKGKHFPFEKSQSGEQEPIVTTADRLMQKEKVDDAIKYIDGLKKRIPDYELELIIKEKGVA